MEEITQSEILLRGRLSGSQKNRLGKLLDMLYTPSELAAELGISNRQFSRVYIPAGCPYQKDSKGRYWINGKAFREWAKDVYKKLPLGADEVFCLTCKHPVKMVKPEKKKSGDLVYYLCKCPDCGRVIARIIEKGKSRKDD